MKLHLLYQGWSGFVVDSVDEPCLPGVVFDPAPDVALDDRPMIFFVTHGHPEHVIGAAQHLRAIRTFPVTVVGSASVCRYLKRSSINANDRFHCAAMDDDFEIAGWKARVFAWDHMSLLPPEWCAKFAHLARLISHPVQLARIASRGIGGPSHFPMLGYSVRPVSRAGKPLVYFGEGLHRRTTPERLRSGLGAAPIGALIAAVEPEDAPRLPNLLSSYPIGRWFAFEAHRRWREKFGMRQLELPELIAQMANKGSISFRALSPGDAFDLDTSE